MQIKTFKDHQALSTAAAAEIIQLIQQKRDTVICMASGETPRLTCQIFAERVRKEQTDVRRCTFVGLDEWVGIPTDNEGSCHHFFQTELLGQLNLAPSQVHLFNAMSDNLPEECRKMDRAIADKGGIDLMLVGIGMNGHIGFNEPGMSFNSYSHVIDLDETTISVGQKYFKRPVKLKQGITLGLKHLMEARKVLLLANGAKKAAVIKQAVEGPVSEKFPASIIQTHPQGIVMVDEEAAVSLSKK